MTEKFIVSGRRIRQLPNPSAPAQLNSITESDCKSLHMCNLAGAPGSRWDDADNVKGWQDSGGDRCQSCLAHCLCREHSSEYCFLDNTEKLTVKGTLAVGTAPWGIAVNPVLNAVYITNTGSGNITPISGATALQT